MPPQRGLETIRFHCEVQWHPDALKAISQHDTTHCGGSLGAIVRCRLVRRRRIVVLNEMVADQGGLQPQGRAVVGLLNEGLGVPAKRGTVGPFDKEKTSGIAG